MIVFAGPSLSHLETLPETLEPRAPVRQGDVYLAALEAPRAIGIIDGYFDGMPSVWHKEILFALSRGIAVFGAASMGALRAAELDVFGMTGIGEIYAAYRDGTLRDDDEVALAHGPEALGYPPLSLAMVNLRATCAAALRAGAIDATLAARLLRAGKAQFFKDRTWRSVIAALDLPEDRARHLRGLIESHMVDQKARDAEALLDRMAAADFPAPRSNFHFERSDLWLRFTAQWRRRRAEPEAQSGGYRLLGEGGSFG
ncbi:TfuA-like protein [Sulfitobacter aestuarii]|uniref:TfuA-like protein n=1 Tax=Sulfitobacter aestuarii TaxID=2161676 RepID=A0ABW5U743_9RHOB